MTLARLLHDHDADTAPVPVKSNGTSWAIQGNRAVIEALKQVEIVVDCTV